MNAAPPPPSQTMRRPQPDRAFRTPLNLAIWAVTWFMMVPPGCRYFEVSYDGPSTYLWGSVLLLSAVVIFQRLPRVLALMKHVNPWMIAFLGWCALSAVWSPMPMHSFKQAVLITTASLLALSFVVAGWDPGRMNRVLVPALFCVVFGSLIVALVDPANGVHSSEQYELKNSWRGLTFQKNMLGQLCAITLMFAVHGLITRMLNPALAVTMAAITFFVLLKSRSSTSLMLALAGCGLLMLQCRPLLGGRTRKLILMPAVGLAVFPILIHFVLGGLGQGGPIGNFIAGIFGKDATFSGRTDIWDLVNLEIDKHPLAGIGYQAFWHGPGSPADPIIRALMWPVPDAHNGYLEIVNALGYVGFALFIAFIVRHWRDTYRLMQLDRAHGALHLSLLIYVLFANLSESGWFRPGALSHFLVILSSLTVSRMLLQYQMVQAAARREAVRAKLARQAAGLSRGTGPPPAGSTG